MFEGEPDHESDAMPSWLYVCTCGKKFWHTVLTHPEMAPVRPCPSCGAEVKGLLK